MQEIIKLTEEEKNKLREKIEALKAFDKVFKIDPRNKLISGTIFDCSNSSSYYGAHENAFNFKEAYDELFINEFVNGNILYNLKSTCLMDLTMGNEKTLKDYIIKHNSAYPDEKFTREQLKDFIETTIQLYKLQVNVLKQKSEGFILSGSDVERFLSFIMNLSKYDDKDLQLTSDDILELLNKNELFKLLKVSQRSTVLSEYIDKLLSSFSITDVDSFINNIEQLYPDYENYPLIILNKTISNEEKIKVIKKTYKQKNLPKYKTFIRNNINDLSVVSLFIDATIFNNNRVKEKEDNFIRALKDFFIFGENYYSRRNRADTTYQNSKEFSEHYKSYFSDGNFISKLYYITVESMSVNVYERRSDFWSFFPIMTEALTLDEKLVMFSNCKQYVLRSEQYKDFINEQFIKALIENDEANVSKLIQLSIIKPTNNLTIIKNSIQNLSSMVFKENLKLERTTNKEYQNKELIKKIAEEYHDANYSKTLEEFIMERADIKDLLKSLQFCIPISNDSSVGDGYYYNRNKSEGYDSLYTALNGDATTFFSDQNTSMIFGLLNSDLINCIPMYKSEEEVRNFGMSYKYLTETLYKYLYNAEYNNGHNWSRNSFLTTFLTSQFTLVLNLLGFIKTKVFVYDPKHGVSDEERCLMCKAFVEKFFKAFENESEEMVNNLMDIAEDKYIQKDSGYQMQDLRSKFAVIIQKIRDTADVCYHFIANTSGESEYLERFENLKNNLDEVDSTLAFLKQI